jgi:hypothetical protein
VRADADVIWDDLLGSAIADDNGDFEMDCGTKGRPRARPPGTRWGDHAEALPKGDLIFV